MVAALELFLMVLHLVEGDMMVIVGIFEGLFGEPEVREALQVVVLMHLLGFRRRLCRRSSIAGDFEIFFVSNEFLSRATGNSADLSTNSKLLPTKSSTPFLKELPKRGISWR